MDFPLNRKFTSSELKVIILIGVIFGANFLPVQFTSGVISLPKLVFERNAFGNSNYWPWLPFIFRDPDKKIANFLALYFVTDLLVPTFYLCCFGIFKNVFLFFSKFLDIGLSS